MTEPLAQKRLEPLESAVEKTEKEVADSWYGKARDASASGRRVRNRERRP
jgi:hypothetical protein